MASGVASGGDDPQAEQGEDWRHLLTMDKDADTKTPVPTEIIGNIPKWLSGSLYRNGVGVFQVGDEWIQHFLDGFAVIHRFIIQDGEVKYQSRILDSEAWVSSCKAKRLMVSGFAAYSHPDPNKSIFDKMMSYLLPLEASDNTSVNIVDHGDKLYALAETRLVNEIDPETLLKKSQIDLKDMLSIHMATAHPHFDTDGTMYNLATDFNPTTAYNIVTVPPKQPGVDEDIFQKASIVTSVPSRFKMHISYNHSFGMSQEHFVILEQPVTINFMKILTANWLREARSTAFIKFPEEKMAFRVVRRSDNQLLPVLFEADYGLCFHFVNCYEVEEHLVVDLCAYNDFDMLNDLYLETMSKPEYWSRAPDASFRRYILPINVTEADPEVNLVTVAGTSATAYMLTPGVIHCTPDYIIHDKICMELPCINYEKFNGKKYRFVYGSVGHFIQFQLVKVDLEQREAVYWKEAGHSAGEPVFVPRPGASDEDDGVLLSPVVSTLPDTPSFLLFLDAKTFKELGRAVAPCDVKMTFSLHGSFVPNRK